MTASEMQSSDVFKDDACSHPFSPTEVETGHRQSPLPA